MTLEETGTKAQGLFLLKNNKFRVPDFLVFSFSELQQISTAKNVALLQIQALLDDLLAENRITGNYFAVRSSSQLEDGSKKSFAGQFKTRTGITLLQVPEAVWEVLSHFREFADQFQDEYGAMKYGIILQQLIVPDFAGVVFSNHPNDPDDRRVFLSLLPGSGEALVSGRNEALHVIIDGKQMQFEGLEHTYSGEDIIGKTALNARKGKEVATIISPILPKLYSEIKRLEQLTAFPVDTEIAIRGNQVYWLQVRPITTLWAKTIAIWDNSAAELNYSGLTLPLTQSFVRRTFHYAYRGLARKLHVSLEQKVLADAISNLSGEINGVLYYRVTAWQRLILELPFGEKVVNYLPKLWGMNEIPFHEKVKIRRYKQFFILGRVLHLLVRDRKIRINYEAQLNSVLNQPVDFSVLNLSQLIDLYRETEKKLGDNWVAPTINGFFAVFFLGAFRKLIENGTIGKKDPNFVNDILQQQHDVISVRMVEDFQELITAIQRDPLTFELFSLHEAVEIHQRFSEITPTVRQLFDAYLNNYGVKAESAELKLETISFGQNPESLIDYLKKNLNLTVVKRAKKQDYISVIKLEYACWNPMRYQLLFLARQSIRRISMRENYRFDRTKVFAFFRNLFAEAGKQLVNAGILTDERDVFYLSVEELLTLNAESVREEQSVRLKEIVKQQKEAYRRYADLPVFTRYRQNVTGIFPVEEKTGTKNLSGTGCCSGIVQATVMLYNETINPKEFKGKIVVSEYFEPGNIGLFSHVAGLISLRGNLLSHTAILCREMGIPSIVGAKGALNQLKDGDVIEMNGATGMIKKITDEKTTG